MNSLEKLIAKHCPGGVEYKQLGEVCGYSDERINSSCITAHTYVGVESLLQEKRGRVDAQNVPSKGSVVAFHRGDVLVGNIRPYLKKIWLADIDGGTNGDVLVIQRNSEEEVSAEYLYYLLSSDDFFSYDTQYAKGGKMPRGDKSAVMKYKIPVPSLPVQKEIVRMLDDMTGLIGAIEEEIEVRKKQYEWCRDKMLKLEGVKRKSLGELAIEFYRGNGILKTQVTPSGIPCVRYGEIYTSYGTSFCQCISHTKLEYISSPKYFEHGDILFAITGEKIDEIGKSIAYVGDERCLAGGDIAVMKHAQNAKFLSYALASADAQRQKSRGKVKSKVVHLSVPDLKAVTIPVPPDNVQNTIANKLDDMTNLIAALEEELVARKQQYEYYRDKLLTFKRKGGGHS